MAKKKRTKKNPRYPHQKFDSDGKIMPTASTLAGTLWRFGNKPNYKRVTKTEQANYAAGTGKPRTKKKTKKKAKKKAGKK